MTKNKRLRELDFLRGIAIILVLLRHSDIHPYVVNIGWIGVDLFFVLSGFLVSGLLFREYQKHGKLDIKRFLIRRGFKIYPLFYLTAIPYLIIKIIEGRFSLVHLIGDLTFFQNYVSNWGYLYAPGWSLAVEEHFYLSIAFVLYLGSKSNLFKISTKKKNKWLDMIVKSILLILLSCLFLRLLSNYMFPSWYIKNFSLTHLRIDSLLSGVLLSYLYYFKIDKLRTFYKNNYKILFTVSFMCLLWTPFINPIPSFFVKTFGFTLLYISFVILLLIFVMDDKINEKLDYFFTTKIVKYVSIVGVCSYSIYIIHTLIDVLAFKIQSGLEVYLQPLLYFFFTSFTSIFIGFYLTKYVENYFIGIRNKYFPSRVEMMNSTKNQKG